MEGKKSRVAVEFSSLASAGPLEASCALLASSALRRRRRRRLVAAAAAGACVARAHCTQCVRCAHTGAQCARAPARTAQNAARALRDAIKRLCLQDAVCAVRCVATARRCAGDVTQLRRRRCARARHISRARKPQSFWAEPLVLLARQVALAAEPSAAGVLAAGKRGIRAAAAERALRRSPPPSQPGGLAGSTPACMRVPFGGSPSRRGAATRRGG